MHEGELWQVFAENGEPIVGKGALDDAFDEDRTLVMANAHVWLWRRAKDGIEILLQKRAVTKKRSPGFYHISAAGHVDLGETAVQAAARETKEEIGIDLDVDRLFFIHAVRSAKNLQSLLFVYVYEMTGDEEFSFDDGEVELVKWVNLATFQQMTQEAASHKLIDQGRSYFDPLIETIQRLGE
ncbi:MAG TPA: NUDIX domain-containing protein [Candidatus Saccharimonadales bacterium]|nr:NUDIX domain-containing protein [Candidatus Saccharimonadales bacterium]